MLSITPCFTTNTLNLKPISPNDIFVLPPSSTQNRRNSPKPISAVLNTSSFQKPQPPKQHIYQPFRPPPTPLPSQYSTLDVAGQIDVLANRLGLWFEYAPLISSLIREGFSPPSIEEATGISGVEQNRLIVATQVRDSLVQSNADPNLLAFFDTGGAELLYEIRLLSASQRVAAAWYLVENRSDGKAAQELARAIKDFPSRRGEKGWESFDYTLPGDCLSFMYYRQSREHRNPSDQRNSALEQALSVAETEAAKNAVLEEMKGGGEDEEVEAVKSAARVPVVRLTVGEVAQASTVVVLPVCKNDEREVLEAPSECRSEGEFGVVVADKGWGRWVVLPGWDPVLGLGKEGVVVSFKDATVLPWKVNRSYQEEPILVVADRTRKEVAVDGAFYLVNGDPQRGGLKVERGLALKELGFAQSLGTVVLVVRPPKEDDDGQLSDEDWD